jgi:hypothetical protein
MTRVINNMDERVKNQMLKKIQGYGYGDNVYDDELQAYMSTGLGSEMKWIRGIKPEMIKFNKVFDRYTSKIKPKKIPIDWSTDLDK